MPKGRCEGIGPLSVNGCSPVIIVTFSYCDLALAGAGFGIERNCVASSTPWPSGVGIVAR